MVTGNVNESTRIHSGNLTKEEMSTEVIKKRRKRADDDALYTLTARAYDLGKPIEDYLFNNFPAYSISTK